MRQEKAQRKQIEEALKEESARVKLLQQLAITTDEAQSTDEIFRQALANIATHLGWPVGHIYTPAPEDNDTLIAVDIWYCSDDERFASFIQKSTPTAVAIGEGWLGQAAAAGLPIFSQDLSQEPTFARRGEPKQLEIRAGLALPIMAGEEIIAVLEFFSPEAIALDAGLLDLMTHISVQLGRAIERRRARDRLEREELLLAQAERIAHMGSWGLDPTTSTVTWSDELCRIYGVNPADFGATYDAFLDRVHPDDRQRIAEIIQTSVERKQAFQFYHRIVRPDGQVRSLHAQGRPELDEEGNVVRFYGTGQDVTEQLRLQEKLVRQTETLQALEQMGHTITSTFDHQVIFQEVLAQLHELLGAQGVFVLLLQGKHLVFSASSQKGADDPTGRRISADSGVAGQVLATGQAQALFGEEARKRTFEDFVHALGYRPGALLVAPLRLRGDLIGVLEAMHQQPDGFAEEDLLILEAAASWTAIAVQNARLVRRLSASRERLRQLARQVVTTQERERRRISRELHDEAGQALTALKIMLGMLEAGLAPDQPDIAQQLAEAVETTDHTMEQIRLLAHGLHPPVLDKLGLGAAAEAFCVDFVKQTGLDIQTHIEALPQLDEQSAISLYRVLQEALANAARHAEATVVMVTLGLEDGTLVLAVSDDGRGFEAAELTTSPHSGLGLAGMQERVELLGGHLDIDTAPGQGTRIIARVPCPDQQEES